MTLTTPCFMLKHISDGKLEDIYTWGETEERRVENLFFAPIGSVSPEDDGSLLMIDPGEASKRLNIAEKLLLGCGYGRFQDSNAAFKRF